MNTKTCSKCSIDKELFEFSPRKAARDGKASACKPCCAKTSKKSAKDNPESTRATRLKSWDKNYDAARALRLSNWDRELVKGRARYHSNIEYELARAAKYRANNKESRSAYSKEYSKSNRDKLNALCAQRRASKLQRTVSWSNPEAIKAIYAKAAQMTIDTGVIHHVDHIVPLQGRTVSGFHHEDNLQVLTASENCSKSNKF